MQATILFLAPHALNEAPEVLVSPREATPGPSVRSLSLVPRTGSEFDRGNYRNGNYRRIEIAAGMSLPSQPPLASARDIVVRCEQIRKSRGVSPADADNCFLVTACEIAIAQVADFLQQFEKALAYMRNRPGFVRLRLFQSLDDKAAFRFINVAQWRSMPDFIEAFSAPAFKALIQGRFDFTSQIIVADRSPTV